MRFGKLFKHQLQVAGFHLARFFSIIGNHSKFHEHQFEKSNINLTTATIRTQKEYSHIRAYVKAVRESKSQTPRASK